MTFASGANATSSGWRKISDSFPTLAASKILSACSGSTSNGDRFGDGRVFLALAGHLIDRQHLDVLQDHFGEILRAVAVSVRVNTTSTKSPGKMKPATPRTSSTATVTARLPFSMTLDSEAL